MQKLIRIGWMAGLLAVAACSSNRQVRPGGEVVVETSHEDKPEWLNQRAIKQPDGWVFVGHERARDLGLAEDGAKLNVMVNLGDSYKSLLDNAIGHTKKEIPDEADKYLSSTAQFAAKGVIISGALTKEVYWEKIEKSTFGEVQYVYDTYVLVEITLEDYQRGMRYAMDKIKSDSNLGQESVDKIKAYEEKMKIQ